MKESRLIALQVRWGAIGPEDLLAALPYLDAERRHRIDRYRRFEDRYRSALAGCLIQCFRSLVSGDARARSARIGSNGRPSFAPSCGTDFNLSHSGDWVVGAVGPRRLGVDVERVDTTRSIVDSVYAVI